MKGGGYGKRGGGKSCLCMVGRAWLGELGGEAKRAKVRRTRGMNSKGGELSPVAFLVSFQISLKIGAL